MTETDPLAKRRLAMSERVAAFIMRFNLPAIAVLVAIDVSCIVFIDDRTLIAVISATTGGVITSLINERLMLIQYYFGSSHGSGEKQKQINKMMAGKAENTDRYEE